MDIQSSSKKVGEEVENEVEGKVGAILNGGEVTKQANTMLKVGYKRLLKVEIVGLVFVVVTVWGLLTLPLIFFYIPVQYRCNTGTVYHLVCTSTSYKYKK